MSEGKTLGYEAGEVCNRNGCKGIIEEKEVEGGCSCHICAPCSYCMTPREHCPECDWDAAEEQYEQEMEQLKKHKPKPVEPYKWPKSWRERLDEMTGDKIDWVHVPTGGNSTMLKKGKYPEGTTREEVEAIVRGSWGGKFEHFGNGEFTYLAYTD